MTILETIRTGLEGVVTHRLRSGLTVLGIMIGIAAVILTVGPGRGRPTTGHLTDHRAGYQSADDLAREHDIELRHPWWVRLCLHIDHGRCRRPGFEDGRSRHRCGRAHHDGVGDAGGRHDQLDHDRGRHRSVMADGPGPFHDRRRFIAGHDVTSRADVVVLGSTTAEELFGLRDPIGQPVTINGCPCR